MKNKKLITKLLVASLLVSSSGLMQAGPGLWERFKGIFWTTQSQADQLEENLKINLLRAKTLIHPIIQ